jgi:hypothetical protein
MKSNAVAMKTKFALGRVLRRLLVSALAVVICLWLGFMGYIYWAMRQPPEVFGHVMAKMPGPAYLLFPFETMWTEARKGTLHPGDVAPDLTVRKLEDKTSLRLASLWADKPVVLVFGSYT